MCQEKVPQRFVYPTKIQYCTVTEYNLVKIIKTKCYIKGSVNHRTYGNYIISRLKWISVNNIYPYEVAPSNLLIYQ